MRTPAEAARDANNGSDDSLWLACLDRINARGEEYAMCATNMLPLIENEISEFSPAELKLYDMSSEAEK